METSQINHQKDGGSAGEGKHALAAHTLAVTTTPEHTEIARKHGSKPKQKHQKKKIRERACENLFGDGEMKLNITHGGADGERTIAAAA